MQRRQYLENYGNNGNNADGFLGKKILPTLGVSFGLPQYGGGYPLNPFGAGPAVNPYGNVVGGGGINLGIVSVNPLVSFQLTRNEEGEKIFKPFVNLHVTPNDFLVHKFSNFLHNKKQAFHQHLHHHAYPPPPPYYHRPPYYSGPPVYHKPGPGPFIYDRPGFEEGPLVEPSLPGPPRPPYYYAPPPPHIYRDSPAPSTHRLPHYFTQEDFSSLSQNPTFLEDTVNNYQGGFSGDNFNSFRRTINNSSNQIKFNSVIDEYQKRYENQTPFINQPNHDSLLTSSREGKTLAFPTDGRSDKTNRITFEKVNKVRFIKN